MFIDPYYLHRKTQDIYPLAPHNNINTEPRQHRTQPRTIPTSKHPSAAQAPRQSDTVPTSTLHQQRNRQARSPPSATLHQQHNRQPHSAPTSQPTYNQRTLTAKLANYHRPSTTTTDTNTSLRQAQDTRQAQYKCRSPFGVA